MMVEEILLVCLQDSIGDGTMVEEEDYDDDGEQDDYEV